MIRKRVFFFELFLELKGGALVDSKAVKESFEVGINVEVVSFILQIIFQLERDAGSLVDPHDEVVAVPVVKGLDALSLKHFLGVFGQSVVRADVITLVADLNHAVGLEYDGSSREAFLDASQQPHLHTRAPTFQASLN